MSEPAMSIFSGASTERRLLNFSLEDTNDSSYRDISNALVMRGWNKVPYRKRSKLEKRRLPSKQQPVMIWTLADKDIEYGELMPQQVVNHFEGISSLTTKRGFCELLREGLTHIGADRHKLSPRAYNLGDPLHREEFIEDFRVSACINILKWAVLTLHRQHAATLRRQYKERNSRLQGQLEHWHGALGGGGAATGGCTAHAPPQQDPASMESAVGVSEDESGDAAALSDGKLQVPLLQLRKAVLALSRYLRVHREGDWPGVGSAHMAETTSSSSAKLRGRRTVTSSAAVSAAATTGPTPASVAQRLVHHGKLLRNSSLFNNSTCRERAGAALGPRPLYGVGELCPVAPFDCDETDVMADTGSGDDKQGLVRVQTNICGLTEGEWQGILDLSYAIAEGRSSSSFDSSSAAHAATYSDGGDGAEAIGAEHEMHDLYADDIPRLLRLLKGAASVAAADVTDKADATTTSTSSQFASPLHLRLLLILQGCSALRHVQFDLNVGMRNVWVVKAPDASCGTGLRLLYRLSDILEAERGMGGRTCQKYLEEPLLLVPGTGRKTPPGGMSAAPSVVSSFLSGVDVKQIPDVSLAAAPTAAPLQAVLPAPPVLPQLGRKFDLRVWVLVTSFFPLKAYIYSSIYGRACGVGYDLQVGGSGSTLLDPRVHFTNYSVQSKPETAAAAGTSAGNSAKEYAAAAASSGSVGGTGNGKEQGPGPGGRVKNLRSTVDTFRDMTAGQINPNPRDKDKEDDRLGDLLLPHSEVVAAVESASGSWAHSWEAIREQVLQSLQAARVQLPLASGPGEAPRQRHSAAFEFLGYDIILDARTAQPHLLEVNLSPNMARRNSEHAAMIEHMCQGLVELAIVPHELGAGLPEQTTPASLLDSYHEQAQVREFLLCGERGFCSSSSSSVQGSPVPTGGAMKTSHGQWEPLHRPDNIYETASSGTGAAPYVMPAAAPVPTAVSDWSVVKPKRPSSAGFRGRLPSSSITSTGVDINFALQGRAISSGAMAHIDRVSGRFEGLLLLQRWARRYCVIRCRLWHHIRANAAAVLLLAARRFLFRCRVIRRVRRNASICVQCAVRCWSATRRTISTRHSRASIKLQCVWRVARAHRARAQRLVLVSRYRLQRWYLRCKDRWRRRHAFKIVIAARNWMKRRCNAKRVLKHLFKLNVLRRKRQRKYVFLFVQAVLRKRVAAREELKNKCKEVSVLAATAGRNRLLRQMERKRLEMEQHERCLREVVESILTEEIFSVSIKDMWGNSISVPSTAVSSSSSSSRGASTSLGVQLAMLARQCLQEARIDDARRQRNEQELVVVQQQELRLRAGVLSGLSGPVGGGLSRASAPLSNSDAADSGDWDAARRQRRQSIGECTRVLLSRAYGVLNDIEYQRYKKHVFTVQDSVHAVVAKSAAANVAAALPTLPVPLPADLFSDYNAWEKEIRLARAQEEQSHLVQSAQQGKVLLFNGRVIDTGRFQAPAHASESSSEPADPASGSPPTAPAPVWHRRDYQRTDVVEVPVADRKGLKNLFLDTAHPDVSDMGNPGRPPLPAPVPRPRSASAQRATAQQQLQQHQERLQRGREKQESPRRDRQERQEIPRMSRSERLESPRKARPPLATATPTAHNAAAAPAAKPPRKKRPSSASATRGRTSLTAKSVCENVPSVPLDSDLRSASTTAQPVLPRGGWADWCSDERTEEEDAPLSFAAGGHWEPYGFVGSFGGEFVSGSANKPPRGGKAARPSSATATRGRSTKQRVGLPPSASPASHAHAGAGRRAVPRAAQKDAFYDVADCPSVQVPDDDRALTMDRSRMLQSMLQGLGFSER